MTENREDNHCREWLDCKCSHPAHSLRVSLFVHGPGVDDVEIVVEPRFSLSSFNIFQRAWYSLQLFFGLKSDVFDVTLLDEKSINQLSKLIVSYRLLRKLRRARSK